MRITTAKHTRVEENHGFRKRKINAKKIGIATCVGLLKESRILADILRRHGFEVYGVVGARQGHRRKHRSASRNVAKVSV